MLQNPSAAATSGAFPPVTYPRARAAAPKRRETAANPAATRLAFARGFFIYDTLFPIRCTISSPYLSGSAEGQIPCQSSDGI